MAIKESVTRMPRPEKLADVPEIELRGYAIKGLVTLNCALQQLQKVEGSILNRLRVLPRGLMRWRSAMRFLEDLNFELLYTIPEEKVAGLESEIKRSRCEYRQGPAATYAQETDIIIPTREAMVLCWHSHDGKCKMCMKTSCAECELCRTLDRVLTIDRGGRMWSQIDLTSKTEGLGNADD